MVPKRGPFFLGRDRATRVASAPRGLGLYRRAGRDGFFFVKNLAAQAKQYPGKIKPVYVDEQIKRSDGQLVTKQKEAEAYCHRRNAEIQEMLLALAGETVAYSGADLEGISRQLADQWLRGKQRGQNLQELQLDVLKGLAELVATAGSDQDTVELVAGEVTVEVPRSDQARIQEQLDAAAKGEPLTIKVFDPADINKERAKLERLCWNNGFRPSGDDLNTIATRFHTLVQGHMELAEKKKSSGSLTPPTPQLNSKGLTWNRLLEAKSEEGIASGTANGIRKALERLEGWLKVQHDQSLPTAIDGDTALQFRTWLTSDASGLKSSSASKDLRYVNAAFNAAVKQGLILDNPFKNLPRDRRATLQQKRDARKTADANKVLTAEEVRAAYDTMLSNKRGKRDPSFNLFYLQAVTGTRIQEVAGLRRCDFTKRAYRGKTYKCIEIKPWEGRGFGVLGERGGLKTIQSERIIPLPARAHVIWEEMHGKSENPAWPDERPPSETGTWGGNLQRRLRDKVEGWKGSHVWRETMVNYLSNNAHPTRIVEMVAGKDSRSTLSDYTSDDLPSMAAALEAFAQYLDLPAYEA